MQDPLPFEVDSPTESRPARFARTQLQRTPAWMASVAFHATMLTVAFLFAATTVRLTPPTDYRTGVDAAFEEFEEELMEEELDQVVESSDVVPVEDPALSPDVTADELDMQEEPTSSWSSSIGVIGDIEQQVLSMDRFAPSSTTDTGALSSHHHTHTRRNCCSRKRIDRGPKAMTDGLGSALGWLQRHQSFDGSWSCDRFARHCKRNRCDGAGSCPEYGPGITSLALLAFMTDGHTHLNGKYKNVVRRGLRYLRTIQAPDGRIGPQDADGHYLYNHAIGTLALAEAYGLTQAASMKRPAQKAVDYLLAAQNPYSGWRYGVRAGDSDTSMTGWAVLALKAAKLADLNVAPEGFAGAMTWVDKATDTQSWRTGYRTKGDSGARFPEAQQFTPSESMTAAALCIRIFTGAKLDDAPVKGAATLLRNMPPKWDPETGNDFYYWYYGSIAMFQVGGRDWKVWERGIKDALVKTQRRGGDEGGSWDPKSAWGQAGGRVYATAINALTLGIYYRYSRIPRVRRSGRQGR